MTTKVVLFAHFSAHFSDAFFVVFARFARRFSAFLMHSCNLVSLRVPVYLAETKEAAINEPEHSFMRQTARLRTQLTSPTSGISVADEKSREERAKGLAAITWEDVRREKVIVGTPEMVIEQIKELQEALHLSEVVAEFNAGELIPHEHIERSLRLFCEKVIPAFK